MLPRIVRSDLTKPPRWYVVTRYTIRQGLDVKSGEKKEYLLAQIKHDVTDQMETIIANHENEVFHTKVKS